MLHHGGDMNYLFRSEIAGKDRPTPFNDRSAIAVDMGWGASNTPSSLPC